MIVSATDEVLLVINIRLNGNNRSSIFVKIQKAIPRIIFCRLDILEQNLWLESANGRSQAPNQ